MTFDLAQFLAAVAFWFLVGVLVGWLITWAIYTNNQEVLGWIRYHIPWLYSFLNPHFTCPAGYSCVPQ